MDITKIQDRLRVIESENVKILGEVQEVIEYIKARLLDEAIVRVNNLKEYCDEIADVCDELIELVGNISCAKICIESIKSYCKYIIFGKDILSLKIDMVKLDLDYGMPIDISEVISEIQKIIDDSEHIDNNLKEAVEYINEDLNDSSVEYEAEEIDCEVFVLDYFTKYYFYEEDEFEEEWEDALFIIEKISTGDRFEYDGYSFKYGRGGKIVVSKTKEFATLVVEKDIASVKINSEREYLDLKYKFDIEKLEDHTRVSTVIKEGITSVSCMLYIDNDDADDFIKALKYVKSIQEYRKSLRD